MKSLLSSFFIIGFCVLSDTMVYASHTADKARLPISKPKNKSEFKISERKILKNQHKAENDVDEYSNFSMEELRVGFQKLPNESVIQHLKSQCRYALMSDKEIIANRCEVKKVIID